MEYHTMNNSRRTIMASAAVVLVAFATPAFCDQSHDAVGSGSPNKDAHHKPEACKGKKIDQGLFAKGKARWELYYQSAKNGTNCLMVRNLAGGGHFIYAEIDLVKNKKNEENSWAYDWGDPYYQYAGGVNVSNANQHCVSIYGYYDLDGKVKKEKFHCK
jgi:hypothetical protein